MLSAPPAGPALADRRQLTARSCLSAVLSGGTTRLAECWGVVPLLPRQTPDGVVYVGGAAGPLAGDVYATTVCVGRHASLSVGSVAATYARPGGGAVPSSATVRARVGMGARLYWAPKPLVAVAGCRHRTETTVELAADAQLFWADVTVVGRHGEHGGEVWHRRSVDIAGAAVQRQAISLGLDDRRPIDPAVLGGARVVASILVAHSEWMDQGEAPAPWVSPGARAGVLELGGSMVEIVGLGQSLDAVLDGWEALAASMEHATPCTSTDLARYVDSNR